MVSAILLGLTTPAVQNLRARARTSQCSNNLRQLSLAGQQHVSTTGYLPCGGSGARFVGLGSKGFGTEQPGGWTFDVLPYLDDQAIRGIVYTTPSASTVRDQAESIPGVMQCPARTQGPTVANQDVLYSGKFQVQRCARLDYAANAGSNFRETTYGPNDLERADRFFDLLERNAAQPANGAVWYHVSIPPATAMDGTSNTIFAGEKWIPLHGGGPGTDQPAWVGGSLDSLRYGFQTPVPDYINKKSKTRFGSSHVEGSQYVLCDGATVLLSWSVDPLVFAAATGRNDMTELPPDWSNL